MKNFIIGLVVVILIVFLGVRLINSFVTPVWQQAVPYEQQALQARQDEYVAEMESRVARLEAQISGLQAENDRLRNQIAEDENERILYEAVGESVQTVNDIAKWHVYAPTVKFLLIFGVIALCVAIAFVVKYGVEFANKLIKSKRVVVEEE